MAEEAKGLPKLNGIDLKEIFSSFSDPKMQDTLNKAGIQKEVSKALVGDGIATDADIASAKSGIGQFGNEALGVLDKTIKTTINSGAKSIDNGISDLKDLVGNKVNDVIGKVTGDKETEDKNNKLKEKFNDLFNKNTDKEEFMSLKDKDGKWKFFDMKKADEKENFKKTVQDLVNKGTHPTELLESIAKGKRDENGQPIEDKDKEKDADTNTKKKKSDNWKKNAVPIALAVLFAILLVWLLSKLFKKKSQDKKVERDPNEDNTISMAQKKMLADAEETKSKLAEATKSIEDNQEEISQLKSKVSSLQGEISSVKSTSIPVANSSDSESSLNKGDKNTDKAPIPRNPSNKRTSNKRTSNKRTSNKNLEKKVKSVKGKSGASKVVNKGRNKGTNKK